MCLKFRQLKVVPLSSVYINRSKPTRPRETRADKKISKASLEMIPKENPDSQGSPYLAQEKRTLTSSSS